ncbi:MAG: hypothetical protein CSA74_02850 [Rhodobacterales bacterium]|nr:MAG: hypothetical protein CSA74_02850 [Rhodobacterales bacterium]
MMKVIRIDVEDLAYESVSERFEGHVELTIAEPGKARTVTLHFVPHVCLPESTPGSIVTYSLIADALRQARKMPGFRRGEEQFEVVAPAPQMILLTGGEFRASA